MAASIESRVPFLDHPLVEFDGDAARAAQAARRHHQVHPARGDARHAAAGDPVARARWASRCRSGRGSAARSARSSTSSCSVSARAERGLFDPAASARWCNGTRRERITPSGSGRWSTSRSGTGSSSTASRRIACGTSDSPGCPPMHILWVKTRAPPPDRQGRPHPHVRDAARLARAPSRHVRHARRRHGGARRSATGARVLPRPRARAVRAARRARSAPRSGSISRNLVSSLPYAVAQVPIRGDGPCDRRTAARPARTVPTSWCATSWSRRSTCPTGCPAPTVLFQHNVEATIWERHTRRGRQSRHASLHGRAVASDAACGARECRRFDHVVAVSRRRMRDVIRQAYGVDARVGGPDRASTRTSSGPPARVPRKPASIVFTGVDGLDAERGRHRVVRGRDPAAHRAGACPTRRSRSWGAIRRRACRRWRRGDRGVSVTGTVPDVRPYLEAASACRRPAASRWRHAAQDLRGDGDGACGRLDDDRRGGTRRARWRGTSSSPTTPPPSPTP